MHKILLAINKFSLGGAERLVIDQANHLHSQHFAVHTLTLLPEDKTSLKTELRIPPENQHYVCVRNMLDISACLKLAGFIREQQFDAVITNLFLANTFVRAAAFFAGLKNVFSYEHSIYRNKRKWQIMTDRLLAPRTKKIFVGSQDVLDFTAVQERLPREQFVLNYNAADFKKLSISKNRRNELRRTYGISEESVLVVAVGRLIEQKGHRYLIEAFSRLPEKAQLLIFGAGTLENDLERQIKSFALEKRVRLAGIANMSDILSGADIFCLSSLWEGLSVALVQAMAAGKAIVATDVSGTNEAIENEGCCLLVPPAEPYALATALQRMMNDAGLREQLGSSAQKASTRFSIEENVKRLVGALNSQFLPRGPAGLN